MTVVTEVKTLNLTFRLLVLEVVLHYTPRQKAFWGHGDKARP